jgi:predicted MFS family arabinose efflux permease
VTDFKENAGVTTGLLLAAITATGTLAIVLIPVIVDGLITGTGLSAQQAGIVVSCGAYGSTGGTVLALVANGRLPWRKVMGTLLVIMVLAEAISTRLGSFSTLLVVRALHGLAAGFLTAVGYSLISRTTARDRTFALVFVVQSLIQGVALLLLPRLTVKHGAAPTFIFLVVANLTALIALKWVPEPAQPYAQGGSRPSPQARGARFLSWPVAIIPVLMAVLLFQAFNNILATYLFDIGRTQGLSSDLIGRELATSIWLSLGGGLLAAWLRVRFGRMAPLAAGLMVAGLSAVALHTTDGTLYLVANCGLAVTWTFVIAYLYGVGAALDPDGQATIAVTVMSKIGLACGPLVAALLLRGVDYSSIILIAVIGLVGVMACILPVALRLDRAGFPSAPPMDL